MAYAFKKDIEQATQVYSGWPVCMFLSFKRQNRESKTYATAGSAGSMESAAPLSEAEPLSSPVPESVEHAVKETNERAIANIRASFFIVNTPIYKVK